MYVLNCPGLVTEDLTDHYPVCVDGWAVTVVDDPFDISQLDPVEIAGFVGSGFFVLIPLWVAVIGGTYLLKALDR